MKKKNTIIICIPFLAMFFLFAAGNLVSAEERATKNECVAKVKEAADMVKKKGLHATRQAINDKNGPFVWKDSYLFMLDDVGILQAHPMRPDAISYSVRNVMDSNGKRFFLEMVDLANTKGEGWVNYMHPKAGDTKPVSRTAFVFKVPNEEIIIGAGVDE